MVNAAWRPNCKLLLFDHICSPTGWILPASEIVAFYESKGTPVLVDGAHALGQIPLDLDALEPLITLPMPQVALYSKGSAMLHVRKDRQSTVRPLIVSHWSDWENQQSLLSTIASRCPTHGRTRDASAVLSIPYALEWMGRLHSDGWTGLQQENTRRAKHLDASCQRPSMNPYYARTPWWGTWARCCCHHLYVFQKVCHVPIGQGLSPLWDILYQRYNIEVVVFCFKTDRFFAFRYSLMCRTKIWIVCWAP